MVDDPQALEIVIRTRAELEGARAVEAQLERDIVQARALGKEYAGLEAKLKNIRGTLAETGAETGQKLGRPDAGEGESMNAPARRDGTMARPETGIETRAGEGQAEAWTPTAGRVLPHGHQIPTEAPEGGEDTESSENTEDRGGQPEATRQGRPLTLPSPPIGERELTTGHGDRVTVPPAAPNFTANGQPVRTEDGPELQMNVQATQAAGERMRAALERNGQATVSLLNRTLEVIEQQNRRLGEVERRVSELAGQIKSLRNP